MSRFLMLCYGLIQSQDASVLFSHGEANGWARVFLFVCFVLQGTLFFVKIIFLPENLVLFKLLLL